MRVTAVRKIIENEIMTMLKKRKEEIIEKLTTELLKESTENIDYARNAAIEGLSEVEHLLKNHTDAI